MRKNNNMRQSKEISVQADCQLPKQWSNKTKPWRRNRGSQKIHILNSNRALASWFQSCENNCDRKRQCQSRTKIACTHLSNVIVKGVGYVHIKLLVGYLFLGYLNIETSCLKKVTLWAHTESS